MKTIGIGDVVYYARCFQVTNTYDLCELHVRTVYENSFVGVDKQSKQAFILSYDDCERTIFDDRDKALAVVKKAEKNRRVEEKGE